MLGDVGIQIHRVKSNHSFVIVSRIILCDYSRVPYMYVIYSQC